MPALSYDYSFAPGDIPIAARAQGNFDKIATLLNSTKLDNTNIQNLAIITALINDGAVTADKLSAAVRDAIGLNSSGTVHRGKSIIATEEIRANTAYGLMTTPDRVQNIVVPTDGILEISYSALMKQSSVGGARAALFIAGNQLQTRFSAGTGGGSVGASECGVPGTAYYSPITCHAGVGLVTLAAGADTTTADVTTGQALGGVVVSSQSISFMVGGNSVSLAPPAVATGNLRIKVAAGTYDISVQFKASSGSVTVKNRELRVSVEGYG